MIRSARKLICKPSSWPSPRSVPQPPPIPPFLPLSSPLLSLSFSPPFLSSPHCVCLSDPVAFCCAMKGPMPHSLFSPLSLSPLLWLEQSPLTDALSQLLSITPCVRSCVCLSKCESETCEAAYCINQKCFHHNKCLWYKDRHNRYCLKGNMKEENLLCFYNFAFFAGWNYWLMHTLHTRTHSPLHTTAQVLAMQNCKLTKHDCSNTS